MLSCLYPSAAIARAKPSPWRNHHHPLAILDR